MQKLFVLLSFIGIYSYAEDINIQKISSYKYVNLNTESSQYIYLIDYNQKNSILTKFIENDLSNMKNINIRYLPLETGNENLCFQLDSIKKISKVVQGKNKKCQEVMNFRYGKESDLPIAIFSDGSIVKKAFNLNDVLILDYFKIIRQEQERKNEEIKKKAEAFKKIEELNNQKIINHLNEVLNKRIIFNKYFLSKYYYSYYSFGKPIIQPIKKPIAHPIKTKKIESSIVSLSKKIESLPVMTDKKIYNNKLNTQSSLYLFHNLNYNLNEFRNVSSGSKQSNNFANKILLKNKKVKSISEKLTDGNIVYHNPPPIHKKIDINWGKLGKPTKLDYVPQLTNEPDPNIIIKNN